MIQTNQLEPIVLFNYCKGRFWNKHKHFFYWKNKANGNLESDIVSKLNFISFKVDSSKWSRRKIIRLLSKQQGVGCEIAIHQNLGRNRIFIFVKLFSNKLSTTVCSYDNSSFFSWHHSRSRLKLQNGVAIFYEIEIAQRYFSDKIFPFEPKKKHFLVFSFYRRKPHVGFSAQNKLGITMLILQGWFEERDKNCQKYEKKRL